MNRPCAYCGKSDTPRHSGHIIPKSLYPSSTPNRVQRPTVPECETCRVIWTDAETQFRNILVIAGNPNEAVYEKWETVKRSLDKPSGKKWTFDLFESMVPAQTDSGTQYTVYPHKDAKFNLVLRRIVRGLSAYHGLSEAIPDENVWVGYTPDTLPPALKDSLLQYNLGSDFVEYGFMSFDDDSEMRSVWRVRFYGSRDFWGIVSKSSNASEIFGPVFNP